MQQNLFERTSEGEILVSGLQTQMLVLRKKLFADTIAIIPLNSRFQN